MQLPSWKNFWPSLNGFIGKSGQKKIAQKNQFSQFIDLETIFEGQGTPIFFCFANIRCLEVLKKVSSHTSIKWPSVGWSVRHTLLFWVLGFLAKKITKNDHFRFPFLPRRFKWSYLSHFLEIWPEIFFGTSKHLGLAKWKKKLGYPDLRILFLGQLKKLIFLERFLVFVAKFSYEAI